MSKPLRRVPWCRHYAPLIVHLMSGFAFVLGCFVALAHHNLHEVPNAIGLFLGYFMPCSGVLMFAILILEQYFTRFGPQWKRNAWYYHVSIPALYVLVILFLRNSDLLNSMADASTDKLAVAYVLVIVPLLLYLWRVLVPFSLVCDIKKISRGTN